MSDAPAAAVEPSARIVLAPLEDTSTFADRAYTALKDTIVSLNVYEQPGEVRLDERQLASDLGISRTPVREAMAQLEREGFVRSVPRRGIYVVRKSKQEVIEMITAWAALESMAARLITTNATTDEIATLRKHVRDLRERRGARASRRIFRGEHRVSPDHHPHEQERRADRSGREPVHPHAHDPPQDHRRAGSRRPLDPRSHEHHRGARSARRPSAPRTSCATTRSASPSMWRSTPTIWIEAHRGTRSKQRARA